MLICKSLITSVYQIDRLIAYLSSNYQLTAAYTYQYSQNRLKLVTTIVLNLYSFVLMYQHSLRAVARQHEICCFSAHLISLLNPAQTVNLGVSCACCVR